MEYTHHQSLLSIVACHSKSDRIDKSTEIWINAVTKISRYTLIIFDNYAIRSIPDCWREAFIYVLVERHCEYDFGSYKRGLGLARQLNWLSDASHILLTNDSVVGPMTDLKIVINHLYSRKENVVGLTQSQQIYPHIQSYFLLMRTCILDNEEILKFFENINNKKNRFAVIQEYEIGFSRLLNVEKIKTSSFFSSELAIDPSNGHAMGNPTSFPISLMSAGVPVVKKKCIFDSSVNQEGILALQREIYIRNKDVWEALFFDYPNQITSWSHAQTVGIILFTNDRAKIQDWLVFLDRLYQYRLTLIVPFGSHQVHQKAIAMRNFSHYVSSGALRLILLDYPLTKLSAPILFCVCSQYADTKWVCPADAVFLQSPATFILRIQMASKHPMTPILGVTPSFYLRNYIQTLSTFNFA